MMIVLFFGDPLPSGKTFVSDNYPETGRYACFGNPPPGHTITTRLDLRDAFRDWFGSGDIPPVTGIAIEVDTRDLPGEDASSSAFTHQISLKKAE